MDLIVYNVHPWLPAKRLSELPEVQQALRDRKAQCKARALRQAGGKKHPQSLRDDARRFLHLASLPEHRYEPVHILFRHMGTPLPATQLAIIRQLERHGLMKFTRFRSSKSFVRLKQLTDSGYDFLHIPPQSQKGKGETVHTHISHWLQGVGVKRAYEESILECQLQGTNHISDVGFKINGKWHMVEVVVDCFSNIADHVRSCFIDSAEVETLTIVTTQKSMWPKIESKIISDPNLVFFLNRIKFEVVESYMKELWP